MPLDDSILDWDHWDGYMTRSLQCRVDYYWDFPQTMPLFATPLFDARLSNLSLESLWGLFIYIEHVDDFPNIAIYIFTDRHAGRLQKRVFQHVHYSFWYSDIVIFMATRRSRWYHIFAFGDGHFEQRICLCIADAVISFWDGRPRLMAVRWLRKTGANG